MSDAYRNRICYICQPPHVDNCPNCFGWGVHHTRNFPISAGELLFFSDRNRPYEVCEYCGGTPYNEHITEIELPAERLAILGE